MNSNDYNLSLQDPKWKAKARQIRDRDGNKCTRCGTKKNELHVHHKYYLPNREPWDYTDKALITLCVTCHEKEHAGKDISEFVRKGDGKIKKTPKKRNKVKKQKVLIIEETPIKVKRSHKELKELLTNHLAYKETIIEDDIEKMVVDEFNRRHPEHTKKAIKRHKHNPTYKFRVKEMKKIREELKKTPTTEIAGVNLNYTTKHLSL